MTSEFAEVSLPCRFKEPRFNSSAESPRLSSSESPFCTVGNCMDDGLGGKAGGTRSGPQAVKLPAHFLCVALEHLEHL
jgi:hypothetical protein